MTIKELGSICGAWRDRDPTMPEDMPPLCARTETTGKPSDGTWSLDNWRFIMQAGR